MMPKDAGPVLEESGEIRKPVRSDPPIYTIWEGFSHGIRIVPESSIQTVPLQLSPFRNSESVKISE